MSYTPKTWVDGEIIYHQDLNNMEQGIKNAHDELSLKPDSEELGSAAFKDVPTDGDASSEQVVLGSDTRMSDARPASDVHDWAKQQNKPSYDYREIDNTPDLSNFITRSVNDLTNYYLKSETYTKAEVEALIGAIQQFHYEIYATLPASGESNILYLIGPTGSGSDRYEEYVYSNSAFTKIGDTSIDLSGYVTTSALNTALADYTTTANLTTLLAGKQDTISDLATIRSGAAAGATAVQQVTVGTTTTGAAGTNASVTNSGTSTAPVFDFTIPRGIDGADGHNPNLGSYMDVADAPTTNIQDGDYIVVLDITQSPVTGVIYKWDGTAWQSTGRDANMAYFGSSELLADVHIDNTHLVNPKDGALPTAYDALQLKAKLEGVMVSETKVQLVASGDGQNVTVGQYVSGETGQLATPSSSTSQYAWFECEIGAAKRIRFLAGNRPSDAWKAGYSLGYYDGTTWTPIVNGYFDVSATPLTNEVVINIDDDTITHFRTTCQMPSDKSLISTSNFYCYLKSGDDVVEMIDGLDKKVNGQDYEVIGDDIRPASRNVNWKICTTGTTGTNNALEYGSTNHSFGLNPTNYRGKRLLVKANASYYSYYMVLKKEISSTYAPYTVQQLIDGEYLCEEIHYTNDTWYPSKGITDNGTVEIPVPNDAVRILFSGLVLGSNLNRDVQSVQVISTEHIDGTIDEIVKTIPDIVEQQVEPLENSINEIDKTVYGEDTEVIDDLQVETLPTEKISLDKNTIYNFGKQNRVNRAYVIPLKGWDSITITPGSMNTYLGIFKKKIPVGTFNSSAIQSEYVATGCEGYVKQSGSVYRMTIYPTGSESSPNGETTILLSDNAEYLYVQKKYGNTSYNYSPSSIILQKTEKQGGLVEKINGDKDIALSAKTLTIDYGNLDENGKITEDNTHLVTGFIPMVDGFYLEVQDDCYVETGMLYDMQGNLLNKDYFKKRSNFTNIFGSAKMLPQFLIRLVIGGNITSTDIIKKYFTISDSRFIRTIPTGLKFKETLYRLAQLENVVWKNDYRVKYNASTYFEPATWIGVPYSEAGEYTKYLGIHVSLRTFLTAVLNKRSVLYTEMINYNANESKYGLTYHGLSDLSSTYYGTVCSGLTSYVDGSKNVKFSGSQEGVMYARGHRDETTGLTTIEIKENGEWREATIDEVFNLIEPLDFAWNTGHITIISDVYKDAFGDKQFFVWSEQTTPVGFSTPFTKEALLNRLNYTVNTHPSGSSNWKEWAFYRKTSWFAEHPDMPQENSHKYIQDRFFTYPESLSIDPYIATFAGEYAAFSINSDNDDTDIYNNNKAFLNIHRNNGMYDRLQIFNENDDESIATPITVDISTNSGTFIYNSDSIYANDASDKEDWVIVDLTQLSTPLTHGKYKARVINSSDSEIVSGFTHFQMVDISFTCGKTTNPTGIVTTFNSEEGVPYLIRQEKPDGMSSDVSELTNSDVESGEKTLSWSGFSTYKYVKLFVRADYGVVVKRIDMSI